MLKNDQFIETIVIIPTNTKLMKPNNPFTNWGKRTVYKQINHYIDNKYLQNTTVDNETNKILITNEDDKVKLKKIIKKIIKEKTYEDEKKEYAIRNAYNEIMNKL